MLWPTFLCAKILVLFLFSIIIVMKEQILGIGAVQSSGIEAHESREEGIYGQRTC